MTFEEFVKEKNSSAQSTAINWSKKRDDYLKAVDMFYEEVNGYLAKYIAEGQIAIDEITSHITEDYIGSYEVRQKRITIGKESLTLEPFGVNIIGASGRIDLKSRNGTVRFVLVESSAQRVEIKVIEGKRENISENPKQTTDTYVWKIATPPPNITFIELTEASFQNALMDLMND